MQDDVIKVARALCRLNGLCVGFCHTDRCSTAIRNYGEQARAAMVATLELTVEAIDQKDWGTLDENGTAAEVSDWLEQRAKDVTNAG